MQYPQYTLNKLGKIVMSMDFIGPKYLKGSSDKINFLSCKYIRPKKEGIVKWVKKFKKFIYELDEINQIICKIEKLLKHNGLSKDTAKKMQSIFR